MKRNKTILRIRKFILSLLVVVILLSTSGLRIFATEIIGEQNVLDNKNSVASSEQAINNENSNNKINENDVVTKNKSVKLNNSDFIAQDNIEDSNLTIDSHNNTNAEVVTNEEQKDNPTVDVLNKQGTQNSSTSANVNSTQSVDLQNSNSKSLTTQDIPMRNSVSQTETEENTTSQNNAEGNTQLESQTENGDKLEVSGAKGTVEVTNTRSVPDGSEQSQNEVQEGFKVAMKWGGTSNAAYTWNAENNENRVVKLTFYYENQCTSKKYNVGDLKITVPGIGGLNRAGKKKATDIAADVYGTEELKRDWSYKYEASTDTYTFFNNNEIAQGESFNGSFEILWQFNSRECINGYQQSLQATLNDGEKSVLTKELSINFTSKKDTFEIKKSAQYIESADGLNNFVENGKQFSDYVWIQYNYRYNTKELNARGLKTRFLAETFPEGSVIASTSGVTKNEDGTVTYKASESQVGDNTTINKSVIVGYPESYSDCTIRSTVDLYGIYKDEVASGGEQLVPEKLATGEGEIELKNINDQWTYFHETISTDKTMEPDRIYSENLDKDINFKAKVKSTTHISSSSPREYGIAITDDFLQVYTDECKRLKDSEYEFTSVTLPGKNTFHNSNGYEISDGDYDVKVKVLKRDREDPSNRSIASYTTVYEGKWTDTSLTLKNELKDSVAVRVEVYGLTESINEFYINVEGKINISESVENNEYVNPTYIRNCNMTDMLNSQGDSIINDTVTEISYADQSIYEEDIRIYGKGLLRSSDTIVIMEKVELPGYYSAKAEMENFSVDKGIENFTTKQKHSIEVANTQEREISKIKIYGVNEKAELETLIETLKFTYKDLKFKYYLSEDITNDEQNMQDYIRERAKIEKNGKEIFIELDFSDNPIVSKNFSIGYEIDANLTYENYYKDQTPTYKVTTYGILEGTDLEQKITTTYAQNTMVYNQTSKNILIALASHQQLIKLVKSEYTNGEFVEEAVVPLNSEYTYRLKLRNGYNTLNKTEIVDILEHSELTKVNETFPYSESEWYGKLKSVDTKYLESKGGTVKVYYATTTSPDENAWILMEVHADGIWQTVNAQVKAIKVEVEGEIEANSIVHVDVNMNAPTDEALVDKKAYNTYKISAEAMDVYTGVQSSVLNEMPSSNATVRLINKEYNLAITKVDEENGNKLSSVKFAIYDEEGNKVNEGRTGILGTLKITNLKEGTYTLKEEKVPDGYEIPQDYTLIIENGNYTLKQGETIISQGEAALEDTIPTINLTIENKRAEGSIEVYKIDEYLNEQKEEIPLQGVEFELQDTEGNVLFVGTTNEQGKIKFENLPWGKTYVIKETNTLNAYNLAEERNTYLSRLVKDKVVTIKNERKTGTAILSKEDELDASKLEGATYGLFAENDILGKNGEVEFEKDTLIEEKATNEEGQVTFENLAWGDYYIKETKTVYGYELSETKYSFTISAENVENAIQKTEKETRSKAKLQLIKLDDEGNFLKDAEFTLFDKEGNVVIINEEPSVSLTDENGQLNIENIEWGEYYIKETKSPEGYEENNTKYNFIVNRETFLNNNKVVTSVTPEENTQEGTGENGESGESGDQGDPGEPGDLAEPGNQGENGTSGENQVSEPVSIIRNNKKKGKVTLTKYACDSSGEETDQTLENAIYELYKADGTKIEEYTSNENGKIVADNLEWGSYYFQEKEAPEGYSISNKKISFVVNSKNASFEQNLEAYDKLESGEIKINKTIKANTLVETHGNASFMFKIVAKDETKEPEEQEQFTLYRTITFSENDKNDADQEGNITRTIVISDLEAYKYEITEEENYRYNLEEIAPVSTNSSVDGTNKVGIVTLTAIDNKGEITFINKKANNSLLSDSKLITNTTQNSYYLIGIEAIPKQSEYSVGTKITASDFTFTLYYSGGQEEHNVELTEGVTFNGENDYAEDLKGSYLTNIEYTVNGKTFTTQVMYRQVYYIFQVNIMDIR